MKKYLVYYDSGTTNSRIYLLNRDFTVRYTAKVPIGSRNSAIEGSNKVLIKALYELYLDLLTETGVSEDDIEAIYGSGMLTTPYGLHVVPHLPLPVTAKSFADGIYPFYEDTLFRKTIHLIPGMKTVSDDMAFVNNLRGEETELLGTLETLAEKTDSRNVAMIMPGSHTHVINVVDGEFKGIISNLTGEVFQALRAETVMAPILSIHDPVIVPEQVKKGFENLERFGFTRAIYICHATRMFSVGSDNDRYSYAEGVVNGGVRQALEYYCEHLWQGCETAGVVSDELMFQVFKAVFDGSPFIKNVVHIPITSGMSYTVLGLKKILSAKA